MWKINYTRNGQDFQVVYTDSKEIETDSPALETLVLHAIQNPPVLYATPTGPSEIFDPNSSYLSYYLVATILFQKLHVKEWEAQGNYRWPIEEISALGTDPVFSYVDYLRTQRVEFFNKCHTPEGPQGGQFCGDNIELTNLDSSEKKRINRAISAISKVHDLPLDYPKVYVEIATSEDLGDDDGVYNSDENRILLKDQIEVGGPEITFVHEFGHHITLGQEGNYSLNQFQDRIDRTPALSRWRDAVRATSTMQGIQERADRGEPYFEYLNDDREVFARTYAQYIAKRSGDKTLLSQLQENQDNNPNFTWPDSEFGPISAALDEYFKDRHLTASGNNLKNRHTI